MLSHVLAYYRRHGLLYCSKKGKRSTQKEIDGVCVIQVFIAWVGPVSSIYVILDDLNTPTELHILIEHTCAVINLCMSLRG